MNIPLLGITIVRTSTYKSLKDEFAAARAEIITLKQERDILTETCQNQEEEISELKETVKRVDKLEKKLEKSEDNVQKVLLVNAKLLSNNEKLQEDNRELQGRTNQMYAYIMRNENPNQRQTKLALQGSAIQESFHQDFLGEESDNGSTYILD